MLFKLAFRNMRRSARDFAVYFFTLILGVAIFYVFNAIGTQTVFLVLSEDMRHVIQILKNVLSALSVFVAFVLGFLVVYANRFLMKRRNGEFALYLLLGMGKGSVAVVLLLETALVGAISLICGLVAGVALSQVMSAVVVQMFEADMTAYTFVFSLEAFIRTVVCFAVILAVSVVLNLVLVGKCRLIDLMTAGRREERNRMKNPVLRTAVFFAAAAALVYAYYEVTDGVQFIHSPGELIRPIAVGAVSTFLIFWSLSGMLLTLFSARRSRYFRSLNSFTFRQISSRVSTTVVSMTVICLMLFVTICVMSTALSVRSSMNADIDEFAPADAELSRVVVNSETGARLKEFEELFSDNGTQLERYFRETVKLYTYRDASLTIGTSFGDMRDFAAQFLPSGVFSMEQTILRLSDYNALAHFYGNPEYTLENGEYLMLCDALDWVKVRDEVLAAGTAITVFGKTLTPADSACRSGFLDMGANPTNRGIVVVQDEMVPEDAIFKEYIVGNYRAGNAEERQEIEDRLLADAHQIWAADSALVGGISVNTKLDIKASSVGLGAMATFVGLYVGIVFLISGAAVLSLKALSESLDSVNSYRILRQIGAEEGDISRSVFRQTGVFFLLPLILAAVHSVFGMRFSLYILRSLGVGNLGQSVAATAVMFAVVYGGYFLITFVSSRAIVRKEA